MPLKAKTVNTNSTLYRGEGGRGGGREGELKWEGGGT